MHVGITSTGVTWCPSTESATTSSMESSAVNHVQIQTYNRTAGPCLWRRQVDRRLVFDTHAWRDWLVWPWKQMTLQRKCKSVGLSSLCDAGHLNTRTRSKPQESDRNGAYEIRSLWGGTSKMGLLIEPQAWHIQKIFEKFPRFVYILYVIAKICARDTQRLAVNHKPVVAGQQWKKHLTRFQTLPCNKHVRVLHRNSWSIEDLKRDISKMQVRKHHFTPQRDKKTD